MKVRKLIKANCDGGVVDGSHKQNFSSGQVLRISFEQRERDLNGRANLLELCKTP